MHRSSKQQSEARPEFIQFVQSVEETLIKAGQEARRIAEQTGTPLVEWHEDAQGGDTPNGALRTGLIEADQL